MPLLPLLGGALVGAVAELALADRWRRGPSLEQVEPSWEPIDLDLSDGGRLGVIALGAGRPVVLLHGITLRADVWHHQFALADTARVIAVDLRGHGRSVAGTEGPTIAANAADLAHLLTEFELRDAVIAGHSMGGMVLGRFLVDHPDVARERVAGVAFVSTAGRNPARPAPLLRRLSAPLARAAEDRPRLAERVLSVPDSDLGHLMVRRTFGRPAHLADVQEVTRSFEAMRATDFTAAAPSILDHDVLDRLRAWDRPATVIVGSRDPLTPVRESRRLAAALPDADLEIVPGAGHQLMLERPDEVNAALRGLLARTE